MLGAGASYSSGVPLASEMEQYFKAALFKSQSEFASFEDFESARPWDHGDGMSDYAALFGMVYDEPSQRQDFIAKCLSNAKPTWGYIYLVNLLAHNKFNVIFTTNFDDLIQEACFGHSEIVRPLFYAHEASIRGMRLTTSRPKVIKLHGDFLYENLKNTTSETSQLEPTTAEKMRLLSKEYGLIVVGYSGRDVSVMDAIDSILAERSGFVHGVYWCALQGEQLSPRVEALAKYPAFHLISIAGFDDLMAQMHDAHSLTLPAELFDPIKIVEKRYRGLISVSEVPRSGSVVIVRDSERMLECIRRVASVSVRTQQRHLIGDQDESGGASAVSYELLAQIEERRGELSTAVVHLIKHYDVEGNLASLVRAFRLSAKSWILPDEQLKSRIQSARHLFVRDMGAVTDCFLSSLNVRWFEYAEVFLEIAREGIASGATGGMDMDYHSLNCLQLKAHQGLEFSEEDRSELSRIAANPDLIARMGACILLREYTKAADLALQAVNLRALPIDSLSWPIFRLLEGRVPEHPLTKLLNEAGPSKVFGPHVTMPGGVQAIARS